MLPLGNSAKLRVILTSNPNYDLPNNNSDADSGKLGKNPSALREKSTRRPVRRNSEKNGECYYLKVEPMIFRQVQNLSRELSLQTRHENNFKLQLFKSINSCKVWIINWSNSHLGLCEFVNHFPLKFNVFGVFLDFQGNVNDVNGLFLLFSSMLKKKQRTIVRHKQPIDLFLLVDFVCPIVTQESIFFQSGTISCSLAVFLMNNCSNLLGIVTCSLAITHETMLKAAFTWRRVQGVYVGRAVQVGCKC